MRQIYILISICLTILWFNEISYSKADPYPNIEIPIIDGAHKVKKFIDNPKGTKSLNYYIRAKYPADKVLQFYDLEFKRNGWIDSNGKMTRQWDCFTDDTVEGNPQVRQLLALWINPKLRTEAFLALRYVKIGDKWGDELFVVCQIQPEIDTTRLENFFRKLEELKQYQEFMRLINSYLMPNGEVDIEKAVRENPNNELLKEYQKVIRETFPSKNIEGAGPNR